MAAVNDKAFIGFPPGTLELVSVTVNPVPWWVKAWHFITRRPLPRTACYRFKATSGHRETTVYTPEP